jgi:predicted dehydrogenase
MNELQVFSPDGSGTRDGKTRIVSGPEHGSHARFNPGAGVSLGYEDLKTIEAHHFLNSIKEKRQGQPGFAEALRVAEVLAAIESSRANGRWQEVVAIGASAHEPTLVGTHRNTN